MRILSVHCHTLRMRTRFPFRYGIAALTELPHVFVAAEVEHRGARARGISADGLAPKWFSKNAETTFEQDDLPAMRRAIGHAVRLAQDIPDCDTFFEWWIQLRDGQAAWAREEHVPPLVAGLGSSLLERAALDAWCRRMGLTFHQAVRDNRLGIELGAVRPELARISVRDVLPPRPLETLSVRHTVGLGDPLDGKGSDAEDYPGDGLPFTLVENLRAYGLSWFKIKLSGQFEFDHPRLRAIARILGEHCPRRPRVTLDGNENFTDMSAFRDQWERHRADPVLRAFLDSTLLFVEQPLHRNQALAEGVHAALSSWPDAPPMIIDESDAEFSSLPDALALGYAGTSHKNCKGVIKSLANAASLLVAREQGRNCIHSAEDLANVGPVALLQDLSVVAALGINHVERNGHHYFAGMSMFEPAEQLRLLRAHPGLLTESSQGFVTLRIADGVMDVRSVNSAPMGVVELPDLSAMEQWFV